jgi:hypothetical protein
MFREFVLIAVRGIVMFLEFYAIEVALEANTAGV